MKRGSRRPDEEVQYSAESRSRFSRNWRKKCYSWIKGWIYVDGAIKHDITHLLVVEFSMASGVLLPTLTALIGLGGFIVGIHSFVAPASAAQIYGVDVVPIHSTAASKEKTDDDDDKSVLQDDGRRHLAYIHSLGIRNLVIGITILILTWEWQFGQSTLAEQAAVQKCLGIVIDVGALTPIVDAVVAWRAGRGREERWDGVGTKAALLRATRSLFWLTGGLWCLSGNAGLH